MVSVSSTTTTKHKRKWNTQFLTHRVLERVCDVPGGDTGVGSGGQAERQNLGHGTQLGSKDGALWDSCTSVDWSTQNKNSGFSQILWGSYLRSTQGEGTWEVDETTYHEVYCNHIRNLIFACDSSGCSLGTCLQEEASVSLRTPVLLAKQSDAKAASWVSTVTPCFSELTVSVSYSFLYPPYWQF